MQNKSAAKMTAFAKFSLALTACSAVLATAYAACTFDATTGHGSVGKGDIQEVFGWNNAALQSNAANLTFTYVRSASYTIQCEWETTTGGKNAKVVEHSVTHTRSADVTSAVVTELKANKAGQVTGFTLCGFDNVSNAGEVPVVGGSAACPGEQGTGAVGTVISVTPMGTSGGLFVNYGSTSVLLVQN